MNQMAGSAFLPGMEAVLTFPTRRKAASASLELIPRLIYLWRMGRLPNWRSPRSFNEFVHARKLYEQDPRWPALADKVAAKDHVAAILGPAWIIPTLWTGTDLPQRPAWPYPFVVKSSHGSQQCLFLRGRRHDPSWNSVCRTSRAWLGRSYGGILNEWLYSQIEPRLLVEPFIGFDHVLPNDFKFFVFGGKVEYIQVDTDREHGHKRVIFDRHWRRVPVELEFPTDPRDIAPPRALAEMIEAAERLGKPFDFVRVDLYEVEGRPLFGELTFYPGSGLDRFRPYSFDTLFGACWRSARSG